ncbi:hypothetical protein C5N14_31190 [Micromonospora sp. MW-13]|nr:hypothetical protein C5N14_31190 [Micromonospora sp. MW-13]
MAYLPPTCNGRVSSIQQTIASMSCATAGALFGRQIMSPREMSISSVRRTVTDIGGNASSTGPSAVSTAAMREVNPDGSTITSSPGFNTPDAT